MAFKIKFWSHEAFTAYTGIAILDPIYHHYEAAFEDGYVKAVLYEWDESCYIVTKPVFSQLYEDRNGRLYFYKFRNKYYLDNMSRYNDILDSASYARIRK